jgi:hypothetical protein
MCWWSAAVEAVQGVLVVAATVVVAAQVASWKQRFIYPQISQSLSVLVVEQVRELSQELMVARRWLVLYLLV